MHTIGRQFLEETFLHHFTAEVSELSHGGQLNRRRVRRVNSELIFDE